MSGGHYDYEEGRIRDFAAKMQPTTPLRRAFKKHLMLVYEACHAVDYVDSGDGGQESEDEAIKRCLGPACDQAAFVESVDALTRTLTDVRNALCAVQPTIKPRPNKPKWKPARKPIREQDPNDGEDGNERE
jgi:hypothetical protein